jgi:hypothetical protein
MISQPLTGLNQQQQQVPGLIPTGATLPNQQQQQQTVLNPSNQQQQQQTVLNPSNQPQQQQTGQNPL